ncbi:MAG: radical SAM protein [Candidatus Competibacteraceae bacterium]
MHDTKLITADPSIFRHAVKSAVPYRPLYVKLKLVWRCNLRCAMCRHWREDSAEALPTEAFLPVIDELAELGCRKLHLSGGEPTLRRDLERLIARASEQGIRVSMTTNATAITAKRADSLVAAGLRRANVSIDSSDPVIHDRLRGVEGSWARTVAGFRELRSRLKKGRLRINTVISADNYLSLKLLPLWASVLGADELNLIPLDAHTDELVGLNRDQIHTFNIQIAPTLAAEGVRLGLLSHAGLAYPFGREDSELKHSKTGDYARGFYERHRCYAPWAHCLIDHAGRVSTCCMTPGKPFLGDLRQQSFSEIWYGPAYRALRAHQALPLFPTCRQCDMFLEQNRRLHDLVKSSPLQRWLSRWPRFRTG